MLLLIAGILIAQADDAGGRAQRNATLLEASRLLGSLTAEARELVDIRDLAGWVAAARRSG